MNDFKDLYKPLIDMLNSYPMVWKEQRRFRSLITDYYPTMKMERNLILACVDEQIPHELAQKNKCSEKDFNRFIKIIEDSYGYTREKAIYALALWIGSLGVISEYDYTPEINELIEIRLDVFDKLSNIQRQVYSNGYIEYEITNTGLAITNIVYSNSEIVPSKSAVVIPEYINGNAIVSLRPDSLNELRKTGYARIVVPSTVRAIGEKGTKLYKSFEGKFSKSVDILFSSIEYKDYQKGSFHDAYIDNESLDLFGYENNNIEYDIPVMLNIKSFMQNRSYWVYPSDDKWILKNKLYKYSGSEETVLVECEEVSSFAFYHSDIERIVFSKSTNRFGSDMIIGCDKLTSIEFCSVSMCYIGHEAIRDCEQLKEIKWPSLIDSNRKILYSGCPLLGDMINNRSLWLCFSTDEIYVVDENVAMINDYAFVRSSVEIVIIPKTVTTVGRDAFKSSSIKVIIFEDSSTKWNAAQWRDDEAYLYVAKGAYLIQNSVFRLGYTYNCYLKNISILEEYIGEKRNLQKIREIVYQNMDQTSDSLIEKANLNFENETSKKLVERSNEYTDMFVHPSPEGTQLGDNYDSEKNESKKQIFGNFEGNTENTGKYGIGLGNGNKLPF